MRQYAIFTNEGIRHLLIESGHESISNLLWGYAILELCDSIFQSFT